MTFPHFGISASLGIQGTGRSPWNGMGIFQRGTPGPGTLRSCLFFEDNIPYGSSRTFLGGFFVPSQRVAMDPRDSVVDCCVLFCGEHPKNPSESIQNQRVFL
jgi:hypothetical protein